MLWCNVKIKETNAYLNFSFDASLISFIKKYCKTRSYDAETKTWKIAIPEYNQLKYVFQNTYSFNEMIEKIEKVDVNDFKEHFDINDIPLKLTLTDEQIKCVDWHINLPKSLNGCTMGLGKTAVAIATALWRKKHNNIKHCLIICGVSGNKYNWNDIEILKTCDEVPFLIDGTGEERYKQFENLPDNFFIICNIETLRLKTKNPIINIIKKQVDSGNIEMIVGDEFHKLKDPTTQSAKALLKLNTPYKLVMSGTFIMNSPLDLYVPLKFIGMEDESFYKYKNLYCVLGVFNEIKGFKNLKYLQQKLDRCMIRFTKDSLDLPPKKYFDKYVDMNAEQQQIYRERCKYIYRNIQKVEFSSNPLSMLTQLRQITGYSGIISDTIKESAKLDYMEQLVKEILARGEKVIIYSIWTTITDEIANRLKDYKILLYTGKESNDARREAKKLFMENDNYKIIIGTISALGTGETLTSANNVIFVDEPWNKALKDQAEDRCHRLGQTKQVNIYTLITNNSIDVAVHNIITKKGALSDKILDGVDKQTQQEIVDEVFQNEISCGNIRAKTKSTL